jgi:hypothetical protein
VDGWRRQFHTRKIKGFVCRNVCGPIPLSTARRRAQNTKKDSTSRRRRWDNVTRARRRCDRGYTTALCVSHTTTRRRLMIKCERARARRPNPPQKNNLGFFLVFGPSAHLVLVERGEGDKLHCLRGQAQLRVTIETVRSVEAEVKETVVSTASVRENSAATRPSCHKTRRAPTPKAREEKERKNGHFCTKTRFALSRYC